MFPLLRSSLDADELERWGGQAVVLPYLEGRSTTRLVQEAGNRGAGAPPTRR